MLTNWEEYTFLALVSAALFLAFFAVDWRVRAGSVTLLAAWVSSQILSYTNIVPWMVAEIAINVGVFYVFLQLHFRREGESQEPLWPLSIMALEFLIFASHLAYWLYGYGLYAKTVNIFFGSELLIIILISLLRIFARISLRTRNKL